MLYSNLSASYLQLGQQDAAVQAARSAVELAPKGFHMVGGDLRHGRKYSLQNSIQMPTPGIYLAVAAGGRVAVAGCAHRDHACVPQHADQQSSGCYA